MYILSCDGNNGDIGAFLKTKGIHVKSFSSVTQKNWNRFAKLDRSDANQHKDKFSLN